MLTIGDILASWQNGAYGLSGPSVWANYPAPQFPVHTGRPPNALPLPPTVAPGQQVAPYVPPTTEGPNNRPLPRTVPPMASAPPPAMPPVQQPQRPINPFAPGAWGPVAGNGTGTMFGPMPPAGGGFPPAGAFPGMGWPLRNQPQTLGATPSVGNQLASFSIQSR